MSTFDVQAKVRSVLDREAAAIRAIRVDATYEAAIDALRLCRGKIVATGMGKAGFLARKFAATLSSTGTPAVFIHPAEAAHGDLGLIAEGDCIVAFSTSGKTLEIVELIELSRHLTSAQVICITSHPESELRRLSDVVLDMGVIEEPCPLGLTPSASMAAMSAIGDALALTLMELKGVTRREYGLRHHGGYLGHKARLANDVE
ncbi:MAG TPA: SIS domain-containing protein [Aliidongia sp.]|uniref:SIS domain-containing protein n=1 Tax=Aliidongia sp. TaxID=1914230 RepID=UPI002DDC93CD|nr:SIS domain-containing protein [Aliidongia sp.]HEV2674869.1 SIS domain-containing protein [Aliidongia sp.]